MKRMTVKQEKFCVAYAKHGNATRAYKEAGYSVKNDGAAGVLAHNLLKNDKIKTRLAQLADEYRTPAIADIQEIQERLTAAIRQELEEEQIVVEGCGDGVSQAVVKKRKTQLREVLKACELLAKMQGAFNDTLKVEMLVPVYGGESDIED